MFLSGLPLAPPFRNKYFSVNFFTACLNALSEVMKLMEVALNPPIFLFRSLPTTFQKNAKSWLFLYPPTKQKRCSTPNFLTNKWKASRTMRWRNFTKDMRPTLAARPPKRCFRAFLCLPARRSVWSSKWMTWKHCKRTCKRTSLLTRHFRLWLEIWHCTAAARWRLAMLLWSQPSTSIFRKKLKRNLERNLSKNIAEKLTKSLWKFSPY